MKSSKVPSSVRLAFWGLISASSLFWILAILLLNGCSGSIFSDQHKKPADDANSPRQNEAWTPAPARRTAPMDTARTRDDASGPDSADGTRFVPGRRDPRLDTVEARVPAPNDFGDPRGRVTTAVSNLELFRILFPVSLGDATNAELDKLLLAITVTTPALDKFAPAAKGALRFRALRETVKGADSEWDQITARTVSLKIANYAKVTGSENLNFVATGRLSETIDDKITVSLVMRPLATAGKFAIQNGTLEREFEHKISSYRITAGNRIRVTINER